MRGQSDAASLDSNQHPISLRMLFFCFIVLQLWTDSPIGASRNNLMLQINLIILEIWPMELLIDFFIHFGLQTSIVGITRLLPVVVWPPDKSRLARPAKQNIHETHIHLNLSLISQLLLQLSEWCSALHATEWIIDFLLTWEIPLPRDHSDYMQKVSFLEGGGRENTKPQNYIFNAMPLVCQMSGFLITVGERNSKGDYLLSKVL